MIGNRIKERRLALGMTQEELANKMGYSSKSSINKIEQGINDIPQSKISMFAKVLKTDVRFLMGWEDYPKDNKFSSDFYDNITQDTEFRILTRSVSGMKQEDQDRIKARLIAYMQGSVDADKD